MADRDNRIRHATWRGNEAHAAVNLMFSDVFCNRSEPVRPIYFFSDVDVCASRPLICRPSMPIKAAMWRCQVNGEIDCHAVLCTNTTTRNRERTSP